MMELVYGQSTSNSTPKSFQGLKDDSDSDGRNEEEVFKMKHNSKKVTGKLMIIFSMSFTIFFEIYEM